MLQKFFAFRLRVKTELELYPVFVICRVPVTWFKSLWGARILLKGQQSSYMGFNPRNAINSLFYQAQWINSDRYGRTGRSPVIGLGSYSLKNWFHLPLLASYIYAHARAVTTLAGLVCLLYLVRFCNNILNFYIKILSINC